MDINDDTAAAILTAAMYGQSDELMARVTADLRFAHYTSAETALRIIRGEGSDGALWLRSATEMNDFSEIEFGQACLASCLPKPEIAAPLMEIGRALDIDIATRVFGAMDAERERIKSETFLLCLSEHDVADTTGRLSMWRAYGGDANVCVLLRTEALTSPQNAYDVDITAVDYGGPAGFELRLVRLLDDVRSHLDQLKLLESGMVVFNLKSVLDDLVLSTKHPGFAEEREWRVIHRRKAHPALPAPPSKVVSIGGTAQIIHYLPMADVPELGVVKANLDDLLERIIIGPTSNPTLVTNAFVRQLREAGVANPEERVTACNIPLRR